MVGVGKPIEVDGPLKLQESRSGLPNFFAKLEAIDSVTVAFLGGSITAAGSGWRDQTMAWLQQHFTGTKIDQVNAGIGGTGSDLGVFRLKKDVLVHHPDLIFVEFAVNDNGRAPETVHRTMEGIVRQIWKADPQTDICFVYTMMADMAPALVEGKLTKTMQAMEAIADHYGIPSVFLGEEVIRLYSQKELLFRGIPDEHPGKTVFSKDGVHPYAETGHRLYAEVLKKALTAMQAVGNLGADRLRDAFDASNWEDAKMIAANDLIKERKWEMVTTKDSVLKTYLVEGFPGLLRGRAADRPAITLKFVGRLVGLYDIVGPGTGQIDIYIDGQLAEQKKRFDKHCTYYRPQYFYKLDMSTGQHTVTFRISDERFDKMDILKQGNHEIADWDGYRSYDCYIGYVLCLGEIAL